MDSTPCVNCGEFFTRRNRLQNYCPAPDCQKARKADWQRSRLHADTEYSKAQELSRKKWRHENPGYWRTYRKAHPEQTERNRALQRIRNRRRAGSSAPEPKCYSAMIANMDARKSCNFNLIGSFWLVPEIAKMDVAKVYFRSITVSCP